MKKALFFILMFAILGNYSCETEPVGDENLTSADGKARKKKKAKILKECLVIDVDRCPNQNNQPTMNFWWPKDGDDNINLPDYFTSTDKNMLIFTEYENGTASITGTTSMVIGSCIVEVNVWLKEKKTWNEWIAIGGDHKKEGCAGQESDSSLLDYYVIDSKNSWITAIGGDCLGEGTYGLEQRPDPNDANTPHYGAHVGLGGANWDSEIDAPGLSTWGWITDLQTGERLWIMDFNFKINCNPNEGEGDGCETAFAQGDNCFLDNGFNRWGWTIGPLNEGTMDTYKIYAGAGKCDISEGEFVGTVDVSYIDGDVTVTYNIDDVFDLDETHTYAGNNMFPVNKNGKPTVAPGKYRVQEDLSGDIYVIAHAVVCKND